MEDRRDILRDRKPFSYAIVKGDKARIFYDGKPVSVISGKDFEKLRRAIELGDEYQAQLAMAKLTGNFKRGNER